MLQLVNYSEKAVALIGDTREIKDDLKKLGGRFNPRLSCGAGWIFSAKQRGELEALVSGKPQDHYARHDNHHPAVYCGTYGKYAGGSIKGAWIDLTTFKSGEDALGWLQKELHKDESDPELMMQDYECFPDWLYSECMGSKDIDAILDWWRKEGCKPTKPEKIDKALLDELKAEYQRMGWNADSYIKDASTIVKLSDGRLLVFDKPSINTRFCFGYSDFGQGMSWDEAHKAAEDARSKEYFMFENLGKYEDKLKKLDDKMWEAQLCAHWYNSEKIVCLTFERAYEIADSDRLDDDTKRAIREALMREKELFTKRLETWWKRYGADKLNIWTYWVDE